MKSISEPALRSILEEHNKWLNGEAGGVRADFAGASLIGADLEGVDLYSVNFCKANLKGANLRRANLTGADLTGAYLERTNLSGATLEGANLANTIYDGVEFKQYQYQRQVAFFDSYTLRIGCETHTLEYWLNNYEDIGKKYGYTAEQIEKYGEFIKGLVK